MDYRSIASRMAQTYKIPEPLFMALVQQESGWDPNAKSKVGAQGLTQAMPATARDPGFGVSPLNDPWNPEDNLRFGAEYLSAMLGRYNGDVPRALAAYNWGAGNADKWDGDVNNLPAETRDYINKITGGQPGMTLAGFSSKGGQRDELIPARNMDGTWNVEDMNRVLGGAINQSQQGGFPPYGPGPSIGLDPNQPAMVDNFGGPQGALSTGQEGPVGDVDKYGWLNKLMPNMTTQQRNDRLLAIGAGLLSGDDWASGIGAAAQGMLGLNQSDAKAAQDEQDRMLDYLMHRERVDATTAQASKFSRVGSVLDPATGEIVGGVGYDPTTNEYFANNPDGTRRVIAGAVPLNNSTAAGDKLVTGPQIAKTQESIMDLQSGLRAIDRILPALDDMKYGVPGFVQDLQTNIKTLSGSLGLSEEEIIRRATQGDIQALIGKARTEVVGPGVMTEQDALRVLAALGGDGASIFSNPEVARELLTRRRDGMIRNYELLHDQYDAFRTIPGSTYVPIDRYTPPTIKRDDNDNADVEEFLRQQGILQ